MEGVPQKTPHEKTWFSDRKLTPSKWNLKRLAWCLQGMLLVYHGIQCWYSRYYSTTSSWRESLTMLFGVIWVIGLGVICHDPCTFQEIIHPKHTVCCFWPVHRKCQKNLPQRPPAKKPDMIISTNRPKCCLKYLIINSKVLGVSHRIHVWYI